MVHIPTFSIVVPVYNVKEYLQQCVGSVMKQTYKDFELILVDDGSTDGSSELCDELSKSEKNIVIIHKENGGLSDARNAGNAISIGEYILYLDSDDYISDTNFLLKASKHLKSNRNIDLLVFGYTKLYSDGKRKEVRFPIQSMYQEAGVETLCRKGCFWVSGWGKIIKRKVIENNNIEFRKGTLSEDMEWCAKLILYCEQAAIWNLSCYIYRQREGSITKNITVNYVDDVANNIRLCIAIENMSGSVQKKEAFKRYISILVTIYMIYLSSIERKYWNKRIENIDKWRRYLERSIQLRGRIFNTCVKLLGSRLTMEIIRIPAHIII